MALTISQLLHSYGVKQTSSKRLAYLANPAGTWMLDWP